jgi:hypothetical protein
MNPPAHIGSRLKTAKISLLSQALALSRGLYCFLHKSLNFLV